METRQVHYTGSNRIGKFNILHEHFNDPKQRAYIQALMALCVVLECYDHESGRGRTYVAASDLFEPLVKDGEEIPEYRIESVYDGHFPEADREARRLNSGRFGFVAIRNHIVRVPPLQVSLRAGLPGTLH